MNRPELLAMLFCFLVLKQRILLPETNPNWFYLLFKGVIGVNFTTHNPHNTLLSELSINLLSLDWREDRK